jgi:hypothetical protein
LGPVEAAKSWLNVTADGQSIFCVALDGNHTSIEVNGWKLMVLVWSPSHRPMRMVQAAKALARHMPLPVSVKLRIDLTSIASGVIVAFGCEVLETLITVRSRNRLGELCHNYEDQRPW